MSESRDRIDLRLKPEIAAVLRVMARGHSRSLNNFVATVLEDMVMRALEDEKARKAVQKFDAQNPSRQKRAAEAHRG